MLSFAFVGATALADGVTLPTYERVELDNGTVLILNRHAEVPLIGLRAILKGGAITDPAGMHGMASLFAALISKGAGDRDAGAFAEAVGGVGGVLTAGAGLEAIEIDAKALLEDHHRKIEIDRVRSAMNQWIEKGRDVVIYTSRDLLLGSSAPDSLAIGQRVSQGLVDIVRGLAVQPSYLVAKGGITSSDLATEALGVRRAMVLGQILPGVPVWRLGSEALYPGMAYIVFPGNVGEVDALSFIRTRLRQTVALVEER